MTRTIRTASTGSRQLKIAARLLAAATLALGGGAALAAPMLYSGFTLIDGSGAKPVANAAMLVDGDHIKWVGPAARAPKTAGATRVDLTGKYVMPGLIDLHIHIGTVQGLKQDESFFTPASVEKDLRTYAAFGVTSVQSMGTDKDSVLPIRDATRSGPQSMARIFTAGQGLVYKTGYGGVPGINHPVSTPAEAVKEVDAQADKGVDYIKLWMDDELGGMPKMPYDISKAIIEEAHRKGKRALAHVFYLADAKMLVAQGIDGFVHTVRDKPVDAELIAAMKAKGTWQVAGTLSREAAVYAFAADNPRTKDPFFRKAANPETIAGLESKEREQSVATSRIYPALPQIDKQAMANFLTIVRSGIPYGFGTDAGPPGRLPGYSEHWELEELVKAGLTPLQAINAATGRAGQWLRTNDRGTIQPGKLADFVVLNADPTANILNTRKIAAVYVGGNQVPSVK
ncbi:amidohydrolase family protein [Sphingomonas nostoxanthinifaciens]|uniref:amidohydrolase family protein n=1 Tax=Sphingomonas nostoxanthinifaciens TaxID=2872652 RepID=UPI001CC1CBC6|nr:amidohydrolase family protein [Sphingomonas nostoxanthinifaciens]UAK23280.1 amidohydrolase family protein [Sphingomonas nostoxanthinifaciens]